METFGIIYKITNKLNGTNEKFESIKAASKKLSISRMAIGNMLAGRSRTAGGLIFEYDNR